MACLAAIDVRSTTGSNLHNITREFGTDPREDITKCKQRIINSRAPVPDVDKWRIPCLANYLDERYSLIIENKDTNEIDALILSLVTS